MENLIIILSYCPTLKKQKVLLNQINELKSNNFDILLHSHCSLPQSIIDKVDHFIYDSTNPVLHWPERGLMKEIWYIHNDLKYTLRSIWPDPSYTVFNQIIGSTNYALSLNYTHYSFINYDLQLTPLIIESLKSPKHDFITSIVKFINEEQRFPSLLLNILSKENLQKITPLISKFMYLDGVKLVNSSNPSSIIYKDFADAEYYWEHLISNFKYEVFESPLYDIIQHINTTDFLKNQYPFRIFSSYNHYPDLDLKDQSKNGPIQLLLYHNYDNEEVTFYINDQKIKTSKSFHLIDLPKKFQNVSLMYKEEIIDLLPHLHKHVIKRIQIENI
jgi:hypothetical protein